MEIIIHKHLPFWFWIVKMKWPSIPLDRVIVAWGSDCYTNSFISPDKVIHESVHHKQQHYSKIYGIYWWIKYLLLKDFRFSQEVEAYRKEYQWVNSQKFSRQIKFEALMEMSKHLSSEFYGNMVKQEVALNIIKNVL